MSWKTLRQAVAIAMLVTGCSGGYPQECPFEIKLLDGGSTSEVRGCGHKSPYDCALELADGGATALWKEYCER